MSRGNIISPGLWLPEWLQRLRDPLEARRRSPSGGRWRTTGGGRFHATQEELEECCCEGGGGGGGEDICNCTMQSAQFVIADYVDSSNATYNFYTSNLNGTYDADVDVFVGGLGLRVSYILGTPGPWTGPLTDPGILIRQEISTGDTLYASEFDLYFTCSGPVGGEYTLHLNSATIWSQWYDLSATSMGSQTASGTSGWLSVESVNIGASCAENAITGTASKLHVSSTDGTYAVTPNFV